MHKYVLNTYCGCISILGFWNNLVNQTLVEFNLHFTLGKLRQFTNNNFKSLNAMKIEQWKGGWGYRAGGVSCNLKRIQGSTY